MENDIVNEWIVDFEKCHERCGDGIDIEATRDVAYNVYVKFKENSEMTSETGSFKQLFVVWKEHGAVFVYTPVATLIMVHTKDSMEVLSTVESSENVSNRTRSSPSSREQRTAGCSCSESC